MSIHEYYPQRFFNELREFLGTPPVLYFGEGWGFNRQRRAEWLQLIDTPSAPLLDCDWGYACPDVEKVPMSSRPLFLVCLYFTVLMDQAMHAHYPAFYERFEQLTRHPKFCEGPGEFYLNPRGILNGPICGGLVNRDEVEAQLDPGMELFVAEAASFFHKHLPAISAPDFFRTLVDDPDVMIPGVFRLLERDDVLNSTEYRVYSALRRATSNAYYKRQA